MKKKFFSEVEYIWKALCVSSFWKRFRIGGQQCEGIYRHHFKITLPNNWLHLSPFYSACSFAFAQQPPDPERSAFLKLRGCAFVCFSFYYDKEEAGGSIVLFITECSGKSRERSCSASAEESKLDGAGRGHGPPLVWGGDGGSSFQMSSIIFTHITQILWENQLSDDRGAEAFAVFVSPSAYGNTHADLASWRWGLTSRAGKTEQPCSSLFLVFHRV